MSEHAANIEADWIDAPREVCDRINKAMRVVETALDDVTMKPTWRHLIAQLRTLNRATEAALVVAVEARAQAHVTPSSVGDAS